MKLGVFTVLYGDRPLEAALERIVAAGVQCVEIGTGNSPGNAHCRPQDFPEAATQDGRRALLRREQIVLTQASEKGREISIPKLGRRKKVGAKELAVFTRQFSGMIDAGLRAVQALPVPVIAMVDGLAVGGGCPALGGNSEGTSPAGTERPVRM